MRGGAFLVAFFLSLPLVAASPLSFIDQPHIRTIMLIPILSMVIVALRLLVGIPLYGVFGPLVIALSLIESGIFFGLVIYIILIAIGIGVKLAITHLKLPIIVEISILMYVVSVLTVLFSVLFEKLSVFREILFPLIITSFLIERFSQAIELNTVERALPVLGSTLATAAGLALIGLGASKLGPASFLALFILSFIIVIGLGYYTGLRLTELFRFKFVGE
ncbi:hypothetical protein D6789_01870 [Candidatus Woesearchaeota archaeon]|nr:MAG: hypothetical protein D6789_01870 [Candidatus Woesearchaeota archaeon]